MNDINLKQYYEQVAKFRTTLPEENPGVEVPVRLALSLVPKNVGYVLDVGCGDGYLCSILKEKTEAVSGVDISKTRIKRAKKRFKGIDFKVGDATALPYKANSFDLVIGVEVLEHIPNLKKSVKEMTRVSRKFVAFTVPYREEPQKIICPYCLKKFYLSGHINYFNEKKIKKLAGGNNLKILKIERISPFPYVQFKSYPGSVKKILNWAITKKTGGSYIGVLLKKQNTYSS